MEKTTDIISLDNEWVVLIKKAKAQGITVEEIRLYFNESGESSS